MTSQRFRAGVGIVLTDGLRVVTFERGDAPNAWQYPQGGIDVGEEPDEAAVRELREETGVSSTEVELLGTHPSWLAYELPPDRRDGRRRGQVHRYYCFRLGRESAIDLERADDEFVSWKWTTPHAAAIEVIEWRRPVYEELARWLGPLLRP